MLLLYNSTQLSWYKHKSESAQIMITNSLSIEQFKLMYEHSVMIEQLKSNGLTVAGTSNEIVNKQ